ncbi:MAG: nucleoside-triphosphatase, partial [Elusimicrobiota bacterium]|nr:nucleoside-triphosphatase [Elusimicrobiota bacterium]
PRAGAARLDAASAGAPPRPASWSVAAPRFGVSTTALLLDAALIVASLRLLKSLPPAPAVAYTAATTALWAWLYPGATRRLTRPGLWAGIFVIAVGAGALLGEGGLEAGLRMALRALLLSAGFAALSQELAAPAVRARLGAWGAGGWLAAVEGAFASLPALIARLPPAPVLLRRPADALSSLLDAAEPPALFLVAGPAGSGKSAFLAALVERLRERKVGVAGLLSPGEHAGGVRTGFDAVDLATGRRVALSRRGGPPEWPALVGPFHFSPEGLAFGRAALAADAEVLVVDEVGPLELAGGGWAAALDALALTRRRPMVWAVRDGLVDAVQARWSAPASAVWTPATDPAAAAAALEAAGQQ